MTEPTWWDDHTDPRTLAMHQLTDAIAERLDQPDAIEMLMRLEAGTAALHIDRTNGCSFVNTLDLPVVVRGGDG